MDLRNPTGHLMLSVAIIACAGILFLFTAIDPATKGITDYAIGLCLLIVGLWNLRTSLHARAEQNRETAASAGDGEDTG